MSHRWSEKVRTAVSFPLTGLDMKPYCQAKSPREELGNTKYDLKACVTHHGGIHGGHYTVCCEVGGEEGGWVRCDDEEVMEVNSDEVGAGEAYLLFYQRREGDLANVARYTL